MSLCADASVGQAHALKCELAGEVLRSFGGLRFKATGWSMLPSVWPGDTLVVERVSPDQVRVGDVVLVGRDGRLRAHRVVSVDEGCRSPRWITQGDANPAPDQPVSRDELLGRVAYLIRSWKTDPGACGVERGRPVDRKDRPALQDCGARSRLSPPRG